MNEQISYQIALTRRDELLRQAADHRRAKQLAEPRPASSTIVIRRMLKSTLSKRVTGVGRRAASLDNTWHGEAR